MPSSAAEPARLVYDSLPSAVLVLGRGGHILHANQAAERLLGTPLRAMRARRPEDVWEIRGADGSTLGPGEQLGMTAISSGLQEHAVLRRIGTRDGRCLSVEVDAVPSLGADGLPYQAVCTLTDVTERREIEARTRQSEREWRQLFQNAGTGMARLDLKGRILKSNRLLSELLDYEGGTLEGRSLAEVLHPDDAANLSFAMLAEFDLNRVESDVRYLRRDGTPVWVHSVVSLVRDGLRRPAFLINTVQDISARKAREAELEHKVLHDVLTGLPNRVLLNDRLLHAMRVARRTGTPLAMLVIDLDGFKEVNDTHGHLSGDRLLVDVAERITEAVRKSDTVARMGGDEFAVILPGIGAAESAAAAAKLCAAFEEPFPMGGEQVRLRASVGIALFPNDGEDVESLLRRADLAMYATKRSGRNGREGLADDADEAADAGASGKRRPAVSAEEIDRRLAILERVSLLMPLSGDQLRRLARRMTQVTVPPGATLNEPGAAASTLRVIEAGSCEVVVDSDPPRPLLVLGAGDFVGSSLVLGEAAGVIVRSATECRLLELPADVVKKVVPAESEFFEELRHVAEQRRTMVARLAGQAARADGAAEARTIAVYSPKGGSGKSTIAINLAAALARAQPDDVLLVDLALPYNHAALLAKLAPTTCLGRIAHHEGDSFEMALRGGMFRHPSGFMILSTALRPEEADLITPDLVGRMLEIVTRMYRFVVFDLGVALSDPVLSVLERADHVVPVVTPELTSMKDASQFLGILTDVLNVPAGSVHLVVNHRSPEAGMTRADVERVLGRPGVVEIAYDGARPEQAALRGEVLVLAQPRSGIARGSGQLASLVGGTSRARSRQPAVETGGERVGWFGYAVT